MKKFLKVFAALFAVLVLAVGGVLGFVLSRPPRDFSATPRPAITASTDPEVIARGQYVAHALAHCSACHGPADTVAKHQLSSDKNALTGGAADPLEGMDAVGVRFSGEPAVEPDPTDEKYEFVVPNLTPDPETGVMAAWTEEAFVARFRAGRQHPGSKMPWENFAQMTDDDLKSLFVYLHSLPPTRKPMGPSRREAGWKPKT